MITEPPPGFEPGTYALRVRCSTPELRRPIVRAKSTVWLGNTQTNDLFQENIDVCLTRDFRADRFV